MHILKLHYLNTPIEYLFFLIKIQNKKLKEIKRNDHSNNFPCFGSILLYSVDLWK